MKKAEMRKEMIAWRSQLDQSVIDRQSGLICKNLVDNLITGGHADKIKTVALYSAFRHEADLSAAADKIWQLGLDIAYPLILTKKNRRYFASRSDNSGMVFIRFNADRDSTLEFLPGLQSWLKPGHFGVLEPPACQEQSVVPELILLPGLAFDLSGNRLGWGKGYYDRYIQKQQVRPLCWGIALDGQVQKQIETDQFDQKVDALVTPAGLIDVIK